MSKIDLQENTTEDEFDIAAIPTLDDFMRELEARESELDISGIKEIEVEIPYTSGKSSGLLPKSAAEAPRPLQSSASNAEVELRSQIEQLKKERLDLSATLNRRQADFDSFRKRTERERSETFQKVLSRLASKMLPVVDNLNRALDSAGNSGDKSIETQQFLDGIVLVNQQIQDTLNEMGIEPILAVGQLFDPHFHEAVSTEQRDDLPVNTIIEELLRGYRVGETVVRAAMVKVAV
jgi:molecular chaperone GrpE